MAELDKKGVYACALAMPSPNAPELHEWVGEISRHVESSSRDQIYLIGHSLGVPAILRYLEQPHAKKVRGVILVSGPIFKTKKKKVDGFLYEPFDFNAIRAKVGHVVVIHGDTDRSVSVDQGETLAKELAGKLVIVKNGGHLNGGSGGNTLPHALKALSDMMK